MMDRLLLAAAMASAVIATPAAQEIPLEYQIKAAYLYNFVKYVEWPEVKSGPFVICVAGQDVFGKVLDNLVSNERVRGRPIKPQVILEYQPECDVIFVPRTSTAAGAYLRGAAGTPTLTVGETPSFTQQGGIIRFFVENGSVRFEINRAAADRARLRISSRLMHLARIAEPEEER